MFLENLVFDAKDPQRLGRFWEQALGGSTLTDDPEVYETRLSTLGGPVLDLAFPRVPEPSSAPPRLHLDLYGGPAQAETVERLLGLGARRLDIGQGDVPWVVLADPEGQAFCVMEEREVYRDTGPIAAVPVLGEDPARDAAFWAGLTGWQEYAGVAPVSLRHPSGRGPVLEFFRTAEPKRAKNRLHLDVRFDPADDPDAELAAAEAAGARRLDQDWGELPWTVMLDPSGNEFCFLPARTP
jgi:hypothetical protein